jgi:hypothetical protein
VQRLPRVLHRRGGGAQARAGAARENCRFGGERCGGGQPGLAGRRVRQVQEREGLVALC